MCWYADRPGPAEARGRDARTLLRDIAKRWISNLIHQKRVEPLCVSDFPDTECQGVVTVTDRYRSGVRCLSGIRLQNEQRCVRWRRTRRLTRATGLQSLVRQRSGAHGRLCGYVRWAEHSEVDARHSKAPTLTCSLSDRSATVDSDGLANRRLVCPRKIGNGQPRVDCRVSSSWCRPAEFHPDRAA